MQYGRALLLDQRLIHATEIDKGQCAEWQVQCPSCAAPIHKRGEIGGDLQYLAHYPGRGNADCELRVQRIVLAEAGLKVYGTVIVPTRESLTAHFAQFEEIMSDIVPTYREPFLETMERLRSRRQLRELLKRLRPLVRREVYQPKNYRSFAPEIQDAMRYVARYITSDNCIRIFAFSIIFAAMYDMSKTPSFTDPLYGEFIGVLLSADDSRLYSYLRECDEHQQRTVILGIVVLVLVAASLFVNLITMRKV